jgi:hypothetical protein
MGGDRVPDITSQIIAVVIFGAWVLFIPALMNRFADSRSQPRIG